VDLKTLIHQTELSDLSIGCSQWWEKVTSIGTPLKIPADNDQSDLIFLWRKQTDDETHDAIYIDINGVINHHDFNAAQLSRYEDSDVYYYVCRVDNSWNGTYSLIPVAEQLKQPLYHGNQQQQITQHREWIIKRRTCHVADPLHKGNLGHCKWGEMHSPLYLDPSIIHPSWKAFDQNQTRSNWESQLQTHKYQSELLDQTRRFWTFSTAKKPEQDLPLVIILDGEFWVESIPVMYALEDGTQKALLPPAVYLMIDAVSFEHRSKDLTCNPAFWQAVIQEILPIVSEHYDISHNPGKNVVTGQSYGGLSALYAVLNWPERFGKAISQSGSFWWPDDSLIHNSHRPDITLSLPDSVYIDNDISALGSRHELSIYMEVGKREQMMVPLAEHVHDKLISYNHNVIMNLYDGGHDRLIWREGLIKGLIWLLSEKQE